MKRRNILNFFLSATGIASAAQTEDRPSVYHEANTHINEVPVSLSPLTSIETCRTVDLRQYIVWSLGHNGIIT